MKIEKISKGSIFLLCEFCELSDFRAEMKNFFFDLSEKEISEFNKNREEINDVLYNFQHLSPVNTLYVSSSEDRKPKELFFENKEYENMKKDIINVFQKYPILFETINKVEKYKEKIDDKLFGSSIDIYGITEIYNISESDDAEPYLLQFYGREWGGAGCGGDCTCQFKPIILKLNESDVKIYQNIPELDGNEDVALNSLKNLNLNEEIINKLNEIIFKDDDCYCLFHIVYFELVKLEGNY